MPQYAIWTWRPQHLRETAGGAPAACWSWLALLCGHDSRSRPGSRMTEFSVVWAYYPGILMRCGGAVTPPARLCGQRRLATSGDANSHACAERIPRMAAGSI